MEQNTPHKELIKAWLDGAEIQWLEATPYEVETEKWTTTHAPSWSRRVTYRIKPQPILVPFSIDDHEILLGHKVKQISGRSISIITRVSLEGLYVGLSYCTYENLLDYYVFINGNPCGREQK